LRKDNIRTTSTELITAPRVEVNRRAKKERIKRSRDEYLVNFFSEERKI